MPQKPRELAGTQADLFFDVIDERPDVTKE